jgi:hypothetical protein
LGANQAAGHANAMHVKVTNKSRKNAPEMTTAYAYQSLFKQTKKVESNLKKKLKVRENYHSTTIPPHC